MFREAAQAGINAGRSKVAFSVTEEGHKFDAEKARILSRAAAELHELAHRYGAVGHRDEKGRYQLASLLGTLRFNVMPDTQDLANLVRPIPNARYFEYVAREHEQGGNAYNPLGGRLTPAAHERGGNWFAYGKPELPDRK